MSAKRSANKLNEILPILEEPFLIAGPCSAESEDQLLETAHGIAQTRRASAIRAGVWKPRTRPGSFEGIGVHALPWLVRAREETGLPIATEVANAQHVEEAMKYGVDILWIGARTTVNPFYVAEIAEALSGTDVVVMVKNPIHPELGLWLGALERLNKAGIDKLMAVHRGFFAMEVAPFRNDPKWELSFEIRKEWPDLPILCDPSHIAGRRDLVEQVAQTALDLNLDGLMIETHRDPDKALSDAAQQLTPADLGKMMDRLILKREEVTEDRTRQFLADIRTRIDAADERLVNVLAERFGLVEEIGKIKHDNGITVFQLQRWFDILQDRTQQAQLKGLEKKFITELFSVIHKYSVNRQTEMGRDSE